MTPCLGQKSLVTKTTWCRYLGYPKIHWFLDIQKSNYGYPKFSMTFGYPKNVFVCIFGYPKMNYRYSNIDLWISVNTFLDIHNYFVISLIHFWIKTAPQMTPCLGQKSLVTKTTWCRKVGKSSAMSHFRLVVSALSPDGRSIWPNKTSRFCHESFWSSFSRVGWSSLGYGTEEYDRVELNSM